VALYYYFISTLPALSYGAQAPWSAEQFRDMAASMLNKEDAALLPYCSLELPEDGVLPKTSSPFINEWYVMLHTMRYTLAHERAAKLKRANPVEDDNSSQRMHQTVMSAVAMSDPLEAEEHIDKECWGALDSLEGLNHFSVNTVYAYLLKLRLLERHAKFAAEKGFTEYKSLYSSILDKGEHPNDRN
jgi:hypothetical protein